MRICLLLFILLSMLQLPLASKSQGRYPARQFYTYRQAVRQGAGGTYDQPRQQESRLLLYLVLWQGRTAEVEQVWIEGKPYAFSTAEVDAPVQRNSGPGLMKGSSGSMQTLVPAGKHTVLQILSETEMEGGTPYPAGMRIFPVLVRYRSGNQIFLVGRPFRELTPLVRQ